MGKQKYTGSADSTGTHLSHALNTTIKQENGYATPCYRSQCKTNCTIALQFEPNKLLKDMLIF